MDRRHWQQQIVQLPHEDQVGAMALSLADNSHWDTLAISGEDAMAFLEGQLTCQVSDLKETQCLKRGALCNHHGRVLANFYVTHYQDQYLLILPNDMAAICMEVLQPYILRSDVKIKNISETIGHVGILGIHPVLNTLFDPIPNAVLQFVTASKWPEMRLTRMGGSRFVFHLMGSWQALQHFFEICHPYCSRCTHASWMLSRFQHNLVDITPATSGLMTPHMLGLDKLDYISFSKGCYRGQEVIARTEYQGTNKRHVSYWLSPKPCHPADVCTTQDQEAVGRVITCIPFDGQFLVQAVVHERALDQALMIGDHAIEAYNLQPFDMV